MEDKRCPRCSQEKPLDEVCWRRLKSGAFSHICRDCFSQAHKPKPKPPDKEEVLEEALVTLPSDKAADLRRLLIEVAKRKIEGLKLYRPMQIQA